MSDEFYTKTGADAQFATEVNLFNEIARAEQAEGKALQKSANLSDLTNPAAARGALGIVDASVIVDNGDGTISVDPTGIQAYTKAGADAKFAPVSEPVGSAAQATANAAVGLAIVLGA